MLWHVRLCIWLMLVIVLIDSDEHLDSTQVPVKRNVRLDQVADFADVIEPEDLAGVAEGAQQGVKVDMVQKREDDSDTGSTLRVAMAVAGEQDLYNKQFDPSLHARDDTSIGNQHKRAIPKKYTDLLDLKYYIAKGLPIRGHGENMLYQNSNIGGFKGRSKRKNRQSAMGNAKGQRKRNNPLNIIPMMNENNPYLSNLADATNDAYLKMRNYANTLMVILTTPKSNLQQSRMRLFAKRPYDFVIKPDMQVSNLPPVTEAHDPPMPLLQQPPPQIAEMELRKVAIVNTPDLKKPNAQKVVKKEIPQLVGRSSEQTESEKTSEKTSETTNTIESDLSEISFMKASTHQGSFTPIVLPTSLRTIKKSPNHHRSSTVHAKTAVIPATTQSPLSWENDLLKSADIKLRRSTPEEVYLLKSNQPKGLSQDSIPIFNDSSTLDMGQKMLTPERTKQPENNTCLMSQNPETDYTLGCEDEDEDESGCIDLPNNGGNQTCDQKTKPVNNKRKIEQRAEPAECEPPKASGAGSSSSGASSGGGKSTSAVDAEGNAKCDQYFTLPIKEVQQHLDEAISTAVAPIKQISDVKPYYPGKPDETDSKCVKEIMMSNSTELPSVSLHLDTGMNQLGNDDDGCGPSPKSNGGKANGGFGDAKGGNGPETTTIAVALVVSSSGNSSNSKSSSEKVYEEPSGAKVAQHTTKVKAKKALMADAAHRTVPNPSQKEATVLEGDYDDSIENTEDPIEQLERLRRDLFVANQLKDLLGKISVESPNKKADKREGRDITNDGNFRETQNSQSDNKPINLDIPPLNREPLEYYDHNDDELTTVDKRFLFRRRRRKKKKAKNVWKHIFGVRSDENRFLNQNFPNSQYAKYPV